MRVWWWCFCGLLGWGLECGGFKEYGSGEKKDAPFWVVVVWGLVFRCGDGGKGARRVETEGGD